MPTRNACSKSAGLVASRLRTKCGKTQAMELTARIVTLRLAQTFVISRESQDEAEVVQVELRHGDLVGYGEAAPIERYHEEAQSAVAYLEALDPGDDPWALDELFARLPP